MCRDGICGDSMSMAVKEDLSGCLAGVSSLIGGEDGEAQQISFG